MSDLDEAAVKRTLLELCQHHKETCDGPECTISLWTVREVFEFLGIELTEEELKVLM